MSAPRADRSVSRLLKATGVAWVLLLVLGPALPSEHPHFDFEQIPSFAALLSVVAAVGLVQTAAWLGRALLDPEDPDA